jgi:hypothetical protein
MNEKNKGQRECSTLKIAVNYVCIRDSHVDDDDDDDMITYRRIGDE